MSLQTCVILDSDEQQQRTYRPGFKLGDRYYGYILAVKDKELAFSIAKELESQAVNLILGQLGRGFVSEEIDTDRVIPL